LRERIEAKILFRIYGGENRLWTKLYISGLAKRIHSNTSGRKANSVAAYF